MATIKDIARKCNVSIATVSNVINNKGKVSQETRDRIWKEAKELNYVPNYMAHTLKQKNNRQIGIIVEDLTVFHTPDIIDGIHEILDENNYTFVLGNMRLCQKYGNKYYFEKSFKKRVLDEINLMLSKQVCGIIYIQSHSHDIDFIPDYIRIPMVSVYGFIEKENVPCVIYDDEHGAQMAVQELIKCGGKKIGVITGSPTSYSTRKRQQGYHKALFDANILYDPQWMEEGDWTRETGYAGGKKLIEKGITHIFAMNDLMAGGIYDYAREHNLVIGRDIKVVGFDDREICQFFYPQLTSVNLPLKQLGEKAAALLVEKMENVEIIDNSVYTIDCTLKVRNST